ncbi:MAG: hypothetical protein ACRD8U_02445 [Pyrinomonadaceae bacterium]
MRNLPEVIARFRIHFRVLFLLAVCSAVVVMTWSSLAAASLTITVVNNSGWEIRHLYLSPANNDNWGADQLNNSSIGPGATRVLNVSWDQPTVKLVAEDQDGCFMSTTVEATGSPTWTINSNAPRNCGG